MVDGGFGEIARRQFLNRLLTRDRRKLSELRPEAIAAAMRLRPPPIFARQALEEMSAGIREDVEQLWQEMPSPEEIGAENFADLLSIRTRLPNTYGHEQGRLDHHVVNYMPFAQPSFLDAVFYTPLEERRNSRAFKRILRERAPELLSLPLVKAGSTYRVWMPSYAAVAWVLFKRRFAGTYVDPMPHRLLTAMEEFVRDLARSASVRTCPYYELPYVDRIVSGYYGGNRALAPEVDRWLSLELWRRAFGLR